MSTSFPITDRFHVAKTNIVCGPMELSLVRDKIMDSACDNPGERDRVVCKDSSGLSSKNNANKHLIDRVLHFVQIVVGYTFGIHLGLAVGWLSGRYIGAVRAEHLRHAVNFLDMNELGQWQNIPWAFAKTGAAIGILVGVVAIGIVESVFLNRTVASLCEKDITEATDIARVLGRSVRQIRKRMRKLAKKGVIGAEYGS